MALPIQFNWGTEYRPVTTGGNTQQDNISTSDINNAYVHYNDYYFSEFSQKVIIRCEPKLVHVESLLSAPVNVHGLAHWDKFMQSLKGGSDAMLVADFLGEAVGAGRLLHKPWMSRKIWKGSEPLVLTLKLKFIATGGTQVTVANGHGEENFLGSDAAGFNEVYYPTCQLMSLIYPGIDRTNGWTLAQPGPSAFHSFRGDDFAEGQRGTDGAVVGYPVDVQVGNFILFQNCYVVSCEIDYSPTLDQAGYPQYADVSLKIESFESPFVDIQTVKELATGGKVESTIGLPFSLFKLNQTTAGLLQNLVDTGQEFVKVAEKVWDSSKQILKR